VTDRELTQKVEYLKEENRFLQSRLSAKITVTPRERGRLIKLGIRVGKVLKELITIVSPRSFARWVAAE
jgi:hypothetical protein